jgi:hypothetical protein
MVKSTRKIEAFKKRSISVTVAPLTVERERKRRRGREVLPSSLLLQRKEDRQGTETDESRVKEMHRAERQTYHLLSGPTHIRYQTRDTKVNSVPLGLPK